MERLIAKWQLENYTEPLLILILCITLIVVLTNRNKHKLLKYIPIYILAFLLIFFINVLNYLIHGGNYQNNFLNGATNYLDYFFTLIEMIIFSHFFYQVISSHLVKKLVIFLNISFFVFFVSMLFKDPKFYQSISETTQSKVYTIEAAILLIICSFYFIETFKRLPTLNLRNEPIFWVSTGLLFFLACTLPYSILENYIEKNYIAVAHPLYSIFHIFYILFSLMIIRAYLCKPRSVAIIK